MDKNHLERITLRKKIMAEHMETVLGAENCVKPAVDEFYVWLVGTYLPTRYPSMFQLLPATDGKPGYLRSLVTEEQLPLLPPINPKDALSLMGGLIDDDLLFLLPSDDGDSVTLKGFVTCFPNGFNTADKLNIKLRDIHTPVPQYKEKLEKSMDRFFDKLKVGRFVKRANVSQSPGLRIVTAQLTESCIVDHPKHRSIVHGNWESWLRGRGSRPRRPEP
jgi:hypothetical protein